MGGIFGGLLTIIQFLGGCFLFLLVGKKAWRDTDNGDVSRTMFGGLVFGALIAATLHLFVFPEWELLTAIIVGVIGGVIFTAVLRGLSGLMG